MKKFGFLAIFIVLAGTAAIFILKNSNEAATGQKPPWIGYAFAGENEDVAGFTVQKGKTFAQIAEAFGIAYDEMLGILETAKEFYNLEKIVEGKEMSFISQKNTGALAGIVYQIDSEEALVLQKNAGGAWNAERLAIPYSVETEEVEGTIGSSLFEAVVGAGGPESVALALAEMFAWQIDFAVDIKAGDSFRAVYEKRFLGGNYVAPGNILAAKFINEGREFSGVYFAGSGGEEDYYDLDGLSLQKIFLKSPLSYKYISSGYSYNRLNPITRSDWGPHRAIDYAADYGTPVVTVGDGTVTFSGWKTSYGKAVFVRHNDTYTTAYGHLSRTAVASGAKVKQGQIIGYVGTTGETTGPHLHFELYKNGAHTNPLTIELPPGDPVAETDRAEFQKTVEGFSEFFSS